MQTKTAAFNQKSAAGLKMHICMPSNCTPVSLRLNWLHNLRASWNRYICSFRRFCGLQLLSATLRGTATSGACAHDFQRLFRAIRGSEPVCSLCILPKERCTQQEETILHLKPAATVTESKCPLHSTDPSRGLEKDSRTLC